MAETLHVAIMPDGNRRWATQQGFTDNQVAYRKAVRRLLEISNTAFAEGVTHLTLWASSCDNWHRRTRPWNLEVSEFLRKAVYEFAECDANLDIIGEWRDMESQETIEAYIEASEISQRRLSSRRLTLLID
jgi:undecaprenyl diphosphate synthase